MPDQQINDQLQAFRKFEDQMSTALDRPSVQNTAAPLFNPESAVPFVAVGSLLWFVIAVALALTATATGTTGTTGSAAMGQLGDAFGVVNAAVSGLAFLALVRALGLQREQLAKQSEELEAQRRELRFQRFAMFLDHEERKASTKQQERANTLAEYGAAMSRVEARLQAIQLLSHKDTWMRTKYYDEDEFLDRLAKLMVEVPESPPSTSIRTEPDQA